MAHRVSITRGGAGDFGGSHRGRPVEISLSLVGIQGAARAVPNFEEAS